MFPSTYSVLTFLSKSQLNFESDVDSFNKASPWKSAINENAWPTEFIFIADTFYFSSAFSAWRKFPLKKIRFHYDGHLFFWFSQQPGFGLFWVSFGSGHVRESVSFRIGRICHQRRFTRHGSQAVLLPAGKQPSKEISSSWICHRSAGKLRNWPLYSWDVSMNRFNYTVTEYPK